MRRPRSSKTDQQNQLDETGATPSCCCFHKGHSLCHPGSSPELAPQEGTRVPSAPYCRPDGTRPRPASPKMSWEPENTDLSFFSLCPRLPRGSFHGRHVRVPSHGETALSGPVRSVFFFSFLRDNTRRYQVPLLFCVGQHARVRHPPPFSGCLPNTGVDRRVPPRQSAIWPPLRVGMGELLGFPWCGVGPSLGAHTVCVYRRVWRGNDAGESIQQLA